MAASKCRRRWRQRSHAGGLWRKDRINAFDALDNDEVIALSQVTAISNFADPAAQQLTQVGGDVVTCDTAGLHITLVTVDPENPDANECLF